MSESRTVTPCTDDAAGVPYEPARPVKPDNISSGAAEIPVPESVPSSESGKNTAPEGTAEHDPTEETVTENTDSGHTVRYSRRIGIWLFRSLILLSCTVFALTAGMGIYRLARDADRDELLSQITGALLTTVFGRAEIVNIPPENVMGNLPVPVNEVESLGADTAEKITEEIREIDLTLSNETPYAPDMNALLFTPRVIPTADELYAEYGSDAPLVLLLHTHATEGYSDSAGSGYRTEDTSRNMVAIGNVIEEKLTAAGINTIHCETLFDAEDFTMAYYNASLEIKRVIADYPSVSYILDIHRDSIETADGEYYAPTASVEGVSAAQLMFVIGTDHGGSGHSTWENNLSLAARLQADISADYPSLMRSINLRSASFNEQYRDGSLLLEVGSCASTLEEASLGAEIFADHLIKEILG